MYIVIRVTEKEVLVGDAAEGVVKRVLIENAFENVQPGDNVELFLDNDTYYMTKNPSVSEIKQLNEKPQEIETVIDSNGVIQHRIKDNSVSYESTGIVALVIGIIGLIVSMNSLGELFDLLRYMDKYVEVDWTYVFSELSANNKIMIIVFLISIVLIISGLFKLVGVTRERR